jgi:hypothetical protein
MMSMASCCDHGEEPLCFIKNGKFLECRSVLSTSQGLCSVELVAVCLLGRFESFGMHCLSHPCHLVLCVLTLSVCHEVACGVMLVTSPSRMTGTSEVVTSWS